MSGRDRRGAPAARGVGLVLLLAAAIAAPAPAAAQSAGGARGWAYDLSDQLMSPFCPGRTLSECPSQQADTLRMWLLVQDAAGRGEEEVKQELIERFGEGILSAPPARGFGLAAYAIPVLTFVAGGCLLWFALRRLTRASPAAPGTPVGPPLDPELERIVDRELSG